MSLLVTGGAGFIGANFARYRRRAHPDERIVVLDALTYAGNLASLEGVERIELVRGDICDAALVERTLRDHGIERVVHFAAESHVDRSLHGPGDFVRTNVAGTATLLERARAAGILRFVQVSTDEVYGDLGPDDASFRESSPLRPRSPYAASKAAADHLAGAWFHTWRFPVLITRCGNNYGPFQFPEKLIPLMILNALGGESLPVYGDGLNRRDWIHVADHCAAIERVLESGREGEVYNIGARCERSNLDVVHEILELTRRPRSLIRMVADRPGHDRRYSIDCEKIERELGWRPEHGFGAGLRETVAWYRDNGAWADGVRSGEYRRWYELNYARRHA